MPSKQPLASDPVVKFAVKRMSLIIGIICLVMALLTLVPSLLLYHHLAQLPAAQAYTYPHVLTFTAAALLALAGIVNLVMWKRQ
ncbi:hypothetical protein JW859_00620 [bacterium]|nr:hypothetical protein [bacterium]